MNRGTILLLTLPALAQAAGPKASKETAPSGIVYSRTELSRIKFSCHFIVNEDNERYSFNPTNVIKCEFTQLSIWLPDNDDAEAAKVIKDFDEGWAKSSQAERDKLAAELKKGCTPEHRAEFTKLKADALADAKRHPAYVAIRPALESPGLGLFDVFCGCAGDRDCMKAAAVKEAREKAARCTLYTGRYDISFRRDFQGSRGWVNVDTMASCYSTITTTLSKPSDAKDSSSLWNMKVTRVPREGATSMFCKDIKLEQTEDTWHEWAEWVEPPCKQFKFLEQRSPSPG